MTTANRRSLRSLQKNTTAPQRSSLFTAAPSCTGPMHSFIPSDPFPSSAPAPSLSSERLHQSSPLPRSSSSITTTRSLTTRPLSPSANHAAPKVEFKNSLSLLILSPHIQLSQFSSRDEAPRNDASSQQPFFQPDRLSPTNMRRSQQFARHCTSRSIANSESHFLLLSARKEYLSKQDKAIPKIVQRPSVQLSSYTLKGSLLPQEATEDTPCNTRYRKRTLHQQTSDINSTRLLRAEKRLHSPTSRNHSTESERL